MRAESSPIFLPLLTRRSCSSGDVKKVDGRSGLRKARGKRTENEIVTILGMAAEQSRPLGDGWKKERPILRCLPDHRGKAFTG